ncbi:MAG: hypothetical protein PUG21_07355 [Prevotella sp.]|nr:hypothetical protein [Prevotella sp.]
MHGCFFLDSRCIAPKDSLICQYPLLFQRFRGKDIANFMGVTPVWLCNIKRRVFKEGKKIPSYYYKESVLCIVRAILYEVFSSIREGMESEEMTDRHLKSSEKLFLRFTKLILDEDHISRKLESYAEQLCVTSKQLAEGLMPVPAHRHRETFSHLIDSYGYILYGRVANPLYIDVRLVAHRLVPLTR